MSDRRTALESELTAALTADHPDPANIRALDDALARENGAQAAQDGQEPREGAQVDADPAPPFTAAQAGVVAAGDQRDVSAAFAQALEAGDTRAVTTAAASGGGLVTEWVTDRVLGPVLTDPSGVLSAITNLGMARNGRVTIPRITTDAAAASGQTAGTATAATDMVVASTELTENRIRAKVEIDRALIPTSRMIAERIVRERMQAQVTLQIENLLITALETASTANSNAGRQTVATSGSVTWADVVGAQNRLHVQRRGGAVLLAGGSLDAGIRAAVNNRGEPLFVPSAQEGMPARVAGMRYYASGAGTSQFGALNAAATTGYVFAPREAVLVTYDDNVAIDATSGDAAGRGVIVVTANMIVGLALTDATANVAAAIRGKA